MEKEKEPTFKEKLPQDERKSSVLSEIKSFFIRIKDFLPTRRKREEALMEAKKKVLRRDIEKGEISELDPEEVKEVKKAVEKAESSQIIEGVDMGELDVPTLLKSYLEGGIVEIETFSPYLVDHDQLNGNFIGFTNSEIIGLELGQHLKKQFPLSRTVALYDEYNNDLIDSTDAFGAPISEGPMLSFSEKAKAKFRKNTIKRLQEYGLIDQSSTEGKDFFIVSESSKIPQAEKLVEYLESKGYIKKEGEEIWFVNQNAENPIYRKILLRNKKGKWMCEALDASSFLEKENRDICHLVVLPQSYKDQQGRVWEILSVLGFKPEKYHNIYFDEGLDPSHITNIVSGKIGEGIKALYEEEESDFDPEEYVKRWYGERILEEDRLLIIEGVKALRDVGLKEGSIGNAADIGTGPNFYPPMLVAPYIQESGKLHLIEYSPSNRRYLEEMVSGEEREYGALLTVWDKFQELMKEKCGESWQDSIEQARAKSFVEAGSIYDLPTQEFNMVSSFFVSESITEDMEEFEKAVNCLLDSVKSGGYIIVAHMLDETSGYPAGEGTHFPSVVITLDDLEHVYAEKADVTVKMVSSEHKAREGYFGMALVVGKKK